MRIDNRLPRVLHVLLHLKQIDKPVTSEEIGKMLGTNASLMRRTMAGLREAGFVGSIKGHGGGWHLIKPLEEISLKQVYDALGAPNLFAVGQSNDAPACLLERTANQATQKALHSAKSSFDAELSKVTLADLFIGSSDKILRYQSKAKNC